MGDKTQRGTIHAEGVEVRPWWDSGGVLHLELVRSFQGHHPIIPAEWFTPDDPYDGWTVSAPSRSLSGQWWVKIVRADGSTHDACYRDSPKKARAAAEDRLAELRGPQRTTDG